MKKIVKKLKQFSNNLDLYFTIYCWDKLSIQNKEVPTIRQWLDSEVLLNDVLEKLLKFQGIFEKSYIEILLENKDILSLYEQEKDCLNLFDVLAEIEPKRFYLSSSFIKLIKNNITGNSVYAPFDDNFLTLQIIESGQVNFELIEEDKICCYFSFLKNIGVFNFNLKISNPIINPSFTQNSNLVKFDTSLLFLFSKYKFNYNFETDIFNRFDHSMNTKRYYIHILEHLLAQTNEKIVALLPLNFFTDETAAVSTFKKMLIDNNWLDKIYFLHKNVIKQTNEHLSLLVIDKHKSDTFLEIYDLGFQEKKAKEMLHYNKIKRLYEYTDKILSLKPKTFDLKELKNTFDFTKMIKSEILRQSQSTEKWEELENKAVKIIRQPRIIYFGDVREEDRLESLIFNTYNLIIKANEKINYLFTIEDENNEKDKEHQILLATLWDFVKKEKLWDKIRNLIPLENDEIIGITTYKYYEINSSCIEEGFIFKIDEKMLEAEKFNLRKVKEYDVLLNTKGDINKVAIVPPAKYIIDTEYFDLKLNNQTYKVPVKHIYDFIPICTSQNIIILRFEEPFDAILVWQFLLSKIGKILLKLLNASSNVSIIKINDLKNLLIPKVNNKHKLEKQSEEQLRNMCDIFYKKYLEAKIKLEELPENLVKKFIEEK